MSSAEKKTAPVKRAKKSVDGAKVGSAPITVVIAFSLAIVALVAAVGAVGVFGYRAYDVYFNEKPSQSARENAVDAAETAILNVLTIDPRDPGAWQRRIDSSMTGEARKQFTVQVVNSLRERLSKAGDNAATITARITRSAATEVNVDDQTGSVIVYAAATPKRNGKAEESTPFGFLVTVGKEGGDHWRATNVTPLDSMALQEPATGDTQQQPGATTTPAPSGGN
ncbi:hypothetical protein GOEFS_110_00230 [Gordonia effusa NBRC 100432]|uniref:Mce-associated membrane protein n=1 Tax=Gordonia effusa NBRC 100432 TaxID=1077974 RepID=H0R5E4_9ACTN|nr:hypothetical protein [Gordonia effusa]GAB20295.1 hypothetical protein GOEFS_110_00230 [Gordonia effusa NBRC 100432]